jgi:hypothetical protein
MTIEQMKGIAKEHMNKQISYLVDDVITADEARATLVALSTFFLVMNSVVIVTVFAKLNLKIFSTIQLKTALHNSGKPFFYILVGVT